MKLVLEINTDGAAFDVMPEREIQALLNNVGHAISEGKEEGSVIDINGNMVGFYELREEEEA